MKQFRIAIAVVALAALGVYVGVSQSGLGASTAPVDGLRGTALDTPRLIEGVTLTDGAGERVTLADYRGDVVVVFFGFTSCPDVCPLTLGRLAKIYQDLGEPTDLQVLMITVDPEHDTPEVTQRYASGFHPSFVGLSGDSSDIAQAARQFFVGFQDIGAGQFSHTDALIVLDRDGQMRIVYSQDNMMHVSSDLETILAQRDW
ncbi:MAG: SCO family protein [Trueperaceae bacterium]|nr:SCO family protein [Trueperaceae bacterium]